MRAVSRTIQQYCGREVSGVRRALRFSSPYQYPLKQELRKAALRVDYNPQKPLKGVLGLTNDLKIPERLEKVLLRQKHDLSVYRDGTIRFDATNVPLTHFKPKQVQTNIAKLREIGYSRDIHGEYWKEMIKCSTLLMQDVIVPFEAGAFLVSVAKYVDDLLMHQGPIWNRTTTCKIPRTSSGI